MKTCAVCNRQINDTASFCRYCGSKVEQSDKTSVDPEKAQTDFKALSLELRQLCDKMTAQFVDTLIRCGQEKETLEAELERVRSELETTKKQLQEAKDDLAAARKQCEALSEELKQRSEAGDIHHEEMDRVCPNCGKPIEDDAVFCGFCGSKLS